MFKAWLGGLLAPRPAALAGRKLCLAVSTQARSPDFYRIGGVPDTPEGRFELYALHLVVMLHRLKGQGPQAAETSQALFDTFLKTLDEGLRDMGVGDLSVGKKMRKLGEALYGRVKGYDAAFQSLPDMTALRALIGRTVFGTADAPQAPPLADYTAAASALLSAEPLDAILDADVRWPAFAPALAPGFAYAG